jgi:predicted MPP superfamily phosphohydrolase
MTTLPRRGAISSSLLGLVLLALLHVYIGARLLPPLGPAALPIGVAALATLLALLLSSLRSGFGRRQQSPALRWAGLMAIGFFSSLLILTLLREPVLLAARFGGQDLALPSAWAVIVLAFGASLLGLANARRRPAIRRVDVPITGLAPALEGFSIVQISDLHVGPTIRSAFVQQVVDASNALQADVIVVTGDVVDGRVAELGEHTAPLGQLNARHGVYAVTGNHEYYSGAHEWIDEFTRLGLKVLMNEHVLLGHATGHLLLAGVADWSAHHFDPRHRSDPVRALHGAPEGAHPRLLLAHQPRSAAGAEAAGFDVQISGHTHGGQFLPWNWFVPLQQPFTAGLHRLGALWVYVSRGTGYWGPPMRLGAPSEITRLRLVRA